MEMGALHGPLAGETAIASRSRAFGRLRPRHATMAEAQVVSPPADDGPATLPIDSAKTFIGPHGTYYDERWRWMEWRGQSRSWNGAAALASGAWLAYRRLYAHAGWHLAWIALLALVTFGGMPLRMLVVLYLLSAAVVGLYGNTWYQQRFRNAAENAAKVRGGHHQRLAALAAQGGVDVNAARWLGAATVATIALMAVVVEAFLGGVRLAF